ncbi:hypothetical protein [Sorangium sp. So ce362]|uniref:hypothetical protein n=1 Tax=Sorangium sp. So ce362 TaxID=3133303 RepID=UPI003F61CB39
MLIRGDAYLCDQRHAEAIAEYQAAADLYIGAGFALRAAAVLRQVVEIIEKAAPEHAEARGRALQALLHCYTALGLTSEAEEVRRLLN